MILPSNLTKHYTGSEIKKSFKVLKFLYLALMVILIQSAFAPTTTTSVITENTPDLAEKKQTEGYNEEHPNVYDYKISGSEFVSAPEVEKREITDTKSLEKKEKISKSKIEKKNKVELTLSESDKPQSLSSNESNIVFDSEGRPHKFSKIISGKATAYTAEKGKRTSTGKLPTCKTAAVNPKIIPYGSELLVVCGNEKIFMKAEDTGGALRRGACVIDRFMKSTEECKKFGRRNVDVYVLECIPY
ncbi:MAG: 3D domain-containing protein [Oscillospiraceae bacterium]|jgi:3D (Asp-Asp-Asp) domain-containing protein|nr:3D domain-containing protein [Oscillospiraceae bacterium]